MVNVEIMTNDGNIRQKFRLSMFAVPEVLQQYDWWYEDPHTVIAYLK